MGAKDEGNSLSSVKRALRALHEMRSRLDVLEAGRFEPIGIVGMACRFPGAAGVSELWELLTSRTDPISEVPPERWNADAFHDPDGTGRGTTLGRWGGFLPELDRFDAAFFGISPREAPHVDPRQRLVLELAWEALEDAGIPPGSLAGSRTGVFVSVLTSDYDDLVTQDLSRFDVYTGSGNANAVVANRVSYVLDLRGPSVVLDTACSGSLVALDLACSALRSGEIDLAISGGVSVNLLPNGDVFFSRAGSLSRSGRCRSFDKDADGIVRSEGAGLVVLERASRATAERRRVWAVIRASAVNHDGRSAGIMAPSGVAQEAVVREAYRRAGVPPGAVRYVEAHGTGTKVGDPVEVRALAAVLGEGREPGRACVLGSVKSNIGHTEAAAGVAGVIKTALALRHGRIPGNLHFRELNPLIPEAGFALEVAGEERAWPEGEGRRVAGVSGFGFGGTNAHVVMEEWEQETSEEVAERASWVVAVSGRTGAAAAEAAGRMAAYLRGAGRSERLSDVAWTAAMGREAMEARLAAVGATHEALAAELEAFAELGAASIPLVEDASHARPLVFAFSGQAPHTVGMGLELAAAEPVFHAALEACDEALRALSGWSIFAALSGDGPSLDEIDVTQPVLFAIQVALARLLESWGIEPDVVVGQSLGEVAAAHVAGALSLEDAARVVFHRSRLLETTAGLGRTAAVGLEPERAAAAIARYAGLCVAGSTGPDTCIVSGDPAALARFAADAEARGDFCRVLENIDTAAHSPLMEPLIAELERELHGLSPRTSRARFVSTVTASEVGGDELGAGYWARNLREPFRFGDAARELIASGHGLFVEIGPHPVLVGALRQWLELGGIDGMAVGTLTRGAGELESVQRAAAAVWERGREVSWEPVIGGPGRTVSLPGYPFQRERFWFDQLEGDGRGVAAPVPAGMHPLLGPHVEAACSPGVHTFETEMSARSPRFLADHRVGGAIVFPAAAYLEMALEAARAALGLARPAIEEARFERLLMIPSDEPVALQLGLREEPDGAARWEVYSRPSGEERGPWTRHASGRLRPCLAEDVADNSTEAAGALAEGDEHYARMAERGIEYGPAFRGVRTVRWSAGAATAMVEAPESIARELGRYRLHPAFLDTALQTISWAGGQAGGTFLPEAIGSLRLHAPASARLVVHATAREGSEAGTAIAEVDLRRETGELVARLEGVRLRTLGAAVRPLTTGLYETTWLERERPILNGATSEGLWLVLADRSGVADRLAESLRDDGVACELVRKRGDGSIESAEAAVSAALARCERDVGAVVSFWALGASLESGNDLRSSCHAQIGAIRALARGARRGSARLWLVTRGAQPVSNVMDPGAAAQAAVWGVGRVAALEHGELWGGLVDLDPDVEDATMASELRAEIASGLAGDEVGFRAGRRFVARLAEATYGTSRAPRLRADASYLVTGGLRGLGLRAARWLVERGARRLVLVGRTRIPRRGHWDRLAPDGRERRLVDAILDLERLGAVVHYARLDVGDERAIAEFLARYRRAGYPPIRGVYHAAAEVIDRLFLGADDEQVDRVLAKARGALALDRELREGLDELVVYSSASSVLGRIGQSAYAAANATVDALAQARRMRGEPALSIAWGPWRDVGWLAGAEDAGFEGVESLSPEEGDEALALAVASGAPQLLVIKADWAVASARPIASELAHRAEGRGTVAPKASGASEAVLDLLLAEPERRFECVLEWVRSAAARVLRTDPGRVAAGRPLPALGMDSVMAVELKNRIERELGLEATIVELFTSTVSEIAGLLDRRLAEDPRLAQLRDEERLAELLAEVEGLDTVDAGLASGVRREAARDE